MWKGFTIGHYIQQNIVSDLPGGDENKTNTRKIDFVGYSGKLIIDYYKKAKAMYLQEKPEKLSVTVIGGESKLIESKKYLVPMVNVAGCVKHIRIRNRKNHKQHIRNRSGKSGKNIP